MPVSLFREVTFPCPRCGREVQARVALVVHADEHPDLVEAARRGALHRVAYVLRTGLTASGLPGNHA